MLTAVIYDKKCVRMHAAMQIAEQKTDRKKPFQELDHANAPTALIKPAPPTTAM